MLHCPDPAPEPAKSPVEVELTQANLWISELELEMAILEEEPSIEAQFAIWHAKQVAILAKYALAATAHPSTPLSPERGVTPRAHTPY